MKNIESINLEGLTVSRLRLNHPTYTTDVVSLRSMGMLFPELGVFGVCPTYIAPVDFLGLEAGQLARYLKTSRQGWIPTDRVDDVLHCHLKFGDPCNQYLEGWVTFDSILARYALSECKDPTKLEDYHCLMDSAGADMVSACKITGIYPKDPVNVARQRLPKLCQEAIETGVSFRPIYTRLNQSGSASEEDWGHFPAFKEN